MLSSGVGGEFCAGAENFRSLEDFGSFRGDPAVVLIVERLLVRPIRQPSWRPRRPGRIQRFLQVLQVAIYQATELT